MASAQGILRPERPKGAPTAILFTSSQLAFNLPAYWRRAKVTVQDGGYSSDTNTTGTPNPGRGGDGGISWVDITPGTPVSVIVGNGAVGGGPGSNTSSSAGGLSSVSQSSRVLVSSATATLKIAGGSAGVNIGSASIQGGAAFLATPSVGNGNLYGGGGGAPAIGSAARAGGGGCVLFELLEA